MIPIPECNTGSGRELIYVMFHPKDSKVGRLGPGINTFAPLVDAAGAAELAWREPSVMRKARFFMVEVMLKLILRSVVRLFFVGCSDCDSD